MPETKKCPNFRKPLIFCHTRSHPDTSADAEQRDGVLPIGLLVRHYPHSAITALTASDYMTTQTLNLDGGMSPLVLRRVAPQR
jgi:hypothetical protein